MTSEKTPKERPTRPTALIGGLLLLMGAMQLWRNLSMPPMDLPNTIKAVVLYILAFGGGLFFLGYAYARRRTKP